jgi:hypothetical protein
MATINHKTYNEATETFKDFSVYDGKETLIFKVDGSEGNVGIGTTSPNKKLTVYGGNDNGIWVDSGGAQYTTIALGNAGSEKVNFAWDNTNVGFLLSSYGASYQAFSTNGSERMRITSAGDVGIGTSAPQQKLSVSSTGVTRVLVENTDNQATGAGIQMLVSNAGTAVSNGTIRMDNADNMSFFNVGGERVSITSAGNVGIGTSAPEVILELNSSVAGLPATTGATQSAGGRMRLTATGAATAVIDFGTAGGNGGWIQAANKSDLTTNYALLLNPNGGNVGIGTTSPSSKLDVNGDIAGRGSFNGFAGATHNLLIDWSSASQFTTLTATDVFFGTNANERMRITSTGDVWLKGVSTSEGHEASFDNTNADFTIYGSRYGGTGKNIQFWATGASESMRITSTGNVGIGTSAPAVKLDVAGRVNAAGNDYHSFSVDQGSAQIRLERTGTSTGVNYIGSDNRGLLITNSAFSTLAIFTANGLTFNGDTAAANALDDYEEGTWTMGVAFGGAAVGVTYSENTGTYTKIGRQVTVNGYLVLTSKGSSTGAARVTGLPFTLGGSGGNYAAASLYFYKITFTNQFSGYGVINTTTVSLEESTTLGVTSFITDADFANDSSIVFCLTYFV